MKSPLISVLMPAYNGASYIAQAIESVLTNRDPNFELIIADDRSTDATREIIETYAKKDKRITWYQNPRNLRCSQNINTLILHAKGSYIKILIQDDVLDPTYLGTCREIFNAHPDVVLVTSFQKFIGDRQEKRGRPLFPGTGLLEGTWVQKHLLHHGNWIGGETAVMIRRDALCVGLWNREWNWTVDKDMWMRILSQGNLYVIPSILSFPRIHSRQATVYLNKDFRFIVEELQQLCIAFLFPDTYGTYSLSERKQLYAQTFDRLIGQGLRTRHAGAIKEMMKIGWEYGNFHFLGLLFRAVAQAVMKKIFVLSRVSCILQAGQW